MTNSKIFSIISKVQLLYKRLHLTIWRCTQVAEGSALEIMFPLWKSKLPKSQ